MEYYVGLDVSLKQTSICIVDQEGLVVLEGVVDFRSRDDFGLREVKGRGCGTHRPRDWTDVDVALDRAQAAWPAGDLYRCAPCQGGAQDADQQKRPQRCYRDRPHYADGLVQGSARQRYRQPLGQGAAGQPGAAGQDQAISRTMFAAFSKTS